jgi:hypothetical protein
VGRPWTCNKEELPKPRTFPCILAWPVAFIYSHRLQEGTECHELHLKIKLKVHYLANQHYLPYGSLGEIRLGSQVALFFEKEILRERLCHEE